MTTPGLSSSEKRRSRGDLVALYAFLQREDAEREALAFSPQHPVSGRMGTPPDRKVQAGL